ncbi:MAG: hypothetical protein V4501_09130 [Pseudomonadota bacterium]
MINTTDVKQHVSKRINMKLIICVIFSFFAALGTLTYGYKFAEYFPLQNTALISYLGVVFAICAMLANMMLGTYSLISMKNKKNQKIYFHILLLSLASAIPYGFLCYFGYQKILPAIVNIPISMMVVIVNTGIGYTAIQNLWLNMKTTLEKSTTKTSHHYAATVINSLGFFIGFSISIMTYLAASSGITELLIHYNLTTLVKYNAGFILAILSWIPCAALFAHANQTVASELYAKVKHFKKFLHSINKTSLALLVFCICSGSSLTQMTADSFAPTKQIPEFFKADYIQMLVQYLIPIALLSSSALNYFSLTRFFSQLKNNH